MTHPDLQKRFINNRYDLDTMTGRLVRMSPQIRLYVTLTLILAAVLAACGSQPASPTSAPLTEVSIQLAWTPNIEYSPFFMAEEKGFFAAEGLKVTIRSGGYDDQGNYISATEQVASGKADFGITDGTDLLVSRAAGKPIVAIASLFQRHPNAYASLADKNIVRPQDLVGKTVMVPPKGKILLLALLASQGIDPAEVNIVDRTDFSINPLVKGEADVIDVFITNESVQLQAEGHKFNQMLSADYGIDSYPNIIFTTEDTIKNRPQVVEGFVRATVKSIEAVIANPQEAAKLAVSRNPELTIEAQEMGMQAALPLLTPADAKPGMMTAQTWEFTANMLLEQGLLQQMPELSQVYTLEFLNKIYGS